MMSVLVRVVFVSVIALLVWTLAESQTIRTERFSVELRLEPGSSSRVIRAASSEDLPATFEVRVSGSASGIDDLTRVLRDPVALVLGIDIPFQPGEQVVDLQATLRSMEMFRKSAVTLVEVVPSSLRIEADDLVTIQVPVRVDLSGVQVEGPARAEPDSIEFRVPSMLRSSIVAYDAFVTASLNEAQLSLISPGIEQRVDGVQVVPSPSLTASWFLRPANAQVAVILKLKSRTASETIPAVPVHIRVVPSELARFDISVAEDDRFIHDVTLRGPGPLIERIRSDPSIRPVAVVVLSFEELERGIEAKDAQFILPPGYEQVEVRADSISVRVTITRREPPPESE